MPDDAVACLVSGLTLDTLKSSLDTRIWIRILGGAERRLRRFIKHILKASCRVLSQIKLHSAFCIYTDEAN